MNRHPRRAQGGEATTETIQYPASGQIESFEWPGFVGLGTSPKAGVRALTTRLEELGAGEPSRQGTVILMGFSQDALVITETLAEAHTRRFARAVPALSESARRQVAVTVSVGNPSFCADEPFNHGTPTPGVSGMFARPRGALASVDHLVIDIAEHDDISAQHVRTSTMARHLAYAERGYVDTWTSSPNS